MSIKKKSLLIAIFLLPILIADLVSYFSIPDKQELKNYKIIVIPRGATLTQIADSLQKNDVIEQSNLFVFWAKSLGYESSFKAGMFQIPDELNYPQLCNFLIDAKPVDLKVTLIEGWSLKELLMELSSELELDYLLLDSLANNSGFCRSTGVSADNLNGYLLPDTYAFPFGVSEEEVLKYLTKRTNALFTSDSVKAKLEHLKYNKHQILTLASIIEGEAILDRERPIISSVYWNRLKRGMRLQADPTIQFILGDKPRRLLYRDLEIDSPYNTYKYAGLPPGPINNPGKASILAALFPQESNYFYFVAKGDGSHVFSRTAAEHAKAKKAFNKVRREVARIKRYQKGN